MGCVFFVFTKIEHVGSNPVKFFENNGRERVAWRTGAFSSFCFSSVLLSQQIIRQAMKKQKRESLINLPLASSWSDQKGLGKRCCFLGFFF